MGKDKTFKANCCWYCEKTWLNYSDQDITRLSNIRLQSLQSLGLSRSKDKALKTMEDTVFSKIARSLPCRNAPVCGEVVDVH